MPASQPPSRLGAIAASLLTLVLFLAAWQGAVVAGWLSPFSAPPPSDIAGAFPDLLAEEGIGGGFLQTLGETLAATLVAAAAGVPIGWALHRSRLAGAAFEGWWASLAAAPLVLLYPLFLVVFGRNAMTIMAMGAVGALPPIVLKTKEGLDGVRPVLGDLARSLRLTRWQHFSRIALPAATPVIGNGLRLGAIFALINVVGVEFLIHFGGLGDIIANLGDRFELPKMFGAILFVVLVSACFYALSARLERWLSRL
jgi:ABC-type nitrate/sulfonate/bicarbonate transport system permease component